MRVLVFASVFSLDPIERTPQNPRGSRFLRLSLAALQTTVQHFFIVVCLDVVFSAPWMEGQSHIDSVAIPGSRYPRVPLPCGSQKTSSPIPRAPAPKQRIRRNQKIYRIPIPVSCCPNRLVDSLDLGPRRLLEVWVDGRGASTSSSKLGSSGVLADSASFLLLTGL